MATTTSSTTISTESLYLKPLGHAADGVLKPIELAGGGPILIGRANSCDLVLVDPTISRRHASLVEREGRWFVIDMGGRQGTYLNGIRLELEELGFAALHPMRYRVIKREIQRIRGNRKEVVTKINNRLKHSLRQEHLVAHIVGREKHLFSIYSKMKEKGLPFSELHVRGGIRKHASAHCGEV